MEWSDWELRVGGGEERTDDSSRTGVADRSEFEKMEFSMDWGWAKKEVLNLDEFKNELKSARSDGVREEDWDGIENLRKVDLNCLSCSGLSGVKESLENMLIAGDAGKLYVGGGEIGKSWLTFRNKCDFLVSNGDEKMGVWVLGFSP
ncbi:hypothetical protein AYI68_g859 [Smittium mucronatum]|uniref:Uncharacterized protein n=1 Tax=Smittium mucronatum TaxID=133383 RepID=A0A1R0H714_9FUNG|nr:hypothetical protein AYI68_g859 [Smittium mucronatum]